MSEEAWNEFLDAEGVADWVVLHSGPTALYRVPSLVAAAALVGRIASTERLRDAGLLMTVTDASVSVRITRDIWSIEAPRHIALARAVSAIARECGAVADRSRTQEVQVAIAAKAESQSVGFWRAVLGYDAMAADNGIDPLGHGSTVWFQELSANKSLQHAMHIDVSVAREHVPARLSAALAAGGRLVDASHAPSHWTLSDPAGNRVCVCAWPDGGARVAEAAAVRPT
jgi:4a-hydroxytetrahydrobiopterin dehydratase